MITLFFILLFTLIALYLRPFIKKHETLTYIISSLFALFALIINQLLYITPILQGFIGLAFFYIVMIASSFPRKSVLYKALMNLRKQYSILGFIFITPHAVYYLYQMVVNGLDWTPLGIIAYLIMIPLTITSFIRIRKTMKPKHWKNLQRLAYIAYVLLIVHLFLNFTNPINLIAYGLIALSYCLFKTSSLYIKFRISLSRA